MTKSKIFTYFALFFLLMVRFPISDFTINLGRLLNTSIFAPWVTPLQSFQGMTFFYWEKVSFILGAFVIIINRHDLKKLNIDRDFLILYCASGILFCFYYLWPLGWIGILIVVFIFYGIAKNRFNLGDDRQSRLMLMVVLLIVLLIISFIIRRISINLSNFKLMFNILLPRLPLWVLEELIFRGMLWMWLDDLHFPKYLVVVFQASLFAIFHVYYMYTSPFYFWVIIPAESLFLGLLVWRYKSITPSAFAHMFINLH